MALTAKDQQAIIDGLAERLTPMIQQCGCGLSENARREMPHLIGMVKDLGKGDYAAGIEVMRANNKILMGFKRVSDRVGMAVLGAVAVGVVSGVFGIIRLLAKIEWSKIFGG